MLQTVETGRVLGHSDKIVRFEQHETRRTSTCNIYLEQTVSFYIFVYYKIS